MKKKQLDREIEKIYQRHAAGLVINIMDISKVFSAAEAAYIRGEPIEPAIVTAIALFCKAYCTKCRQPEAALDTRQCRKCAA